MARHRYLIHYPNGMKRHVDHAELACVGRLTQIGPREYEVPSLQAELEQINSPAFLAGRFVIVEPGGRKVSERLESTWAMHARLIKQGMVAA